MMCMTRLRGGSWTEIERRRKGKEASESEREREGVQRDRHRKIEIGRIRESKRRRETEKERERGTLYIIYRSCITFTFIWLTDNRLFNTFRLWSVAEEDPKKKRYKTEIEMEMETGGQCTCVVVEQKPQARSTNICGFVCLQQICLLSTTSINM